jgi:hypothetical protein
LNRAGERTRAPSHDLAPTTTDFSGIYIRAHPGTTTRRDVEEARARAAEQEAGRGKRVTFGDVEDAMIDGRASWGWLEEERDDRGLQYVEYRAVIPYDTITYTVEFATGDPSWKVKPDSMRVAVLSFAYGQTVWNKGLITLLLVGTVLGVGLLIRRGKSRLYTQTQDMTLVKFEIPEKEPEGETAVEAAVDPSLAPESKPAAGQEPPAPPRRDLEFPS